MSAVVSGALCNLLKCYLYSMHKILVITPSSDKTGCAVRPPGSRVYV